MSGYYGHGSNNCSNGKCPDQTIIDPPKTQYQNIYKQQLVKVIHPIEIVKKTHCCPVYQHCYVYTVREEVAAPQNPGTFTPPVGVPGPASINSYRNKKAKKTSAVSRKASVSNPKAKIKSRTSSKPASKLGSKLTSNRMKKR
ncbi:hypothetical protein OIN60_21835 [Paenibacillus sp. P96]|uniref:Uncharacterized protein n=1 Tax=Paenibacillus zeirhizosphaerae TaxID=2987519 RepID=A0ABT9FXB1_9BACL|nr:hypothetical protein [Paenibacillus sp. P96]MDP4099362.1 hypothetical protein [Paenibacillus sp. P96]